ncbi:MAG: ABC transporter substrate-binding protein [Bacteroidota bacterium]|nr:ABC transporter substrate-binding protein [Bacteroidota bacterium]
MKNKYICNDKTETLSRLMKYFHWIVLFLFFPALLLIHTSCREQYTDESGKVFRYNEAAGISSLDPAFARDQANIWAVHQLFNGLVQLDTRLNICPAIAKSWEISPDGMKYTFHLRKDVFFHDDLVFPGGRGRRVNAHDFVFSFNRITNPRVASPGLWIFNYVSQEKGRYAFDASDDSTFIIRLNQAFPPFLGLLSTVYCSVVPMEAVAEYGQDFRKHPVGTGPFKFKLWKEGIKLVLVKNTRYFETYYGKRLPFLDGVAITFLSDKQSAFLEFLKGRLDFMSGIDPTYKDELLTPDGKLKPRYSGRFHMITKPYLNTEYLGILMDTSLSEVNTSPLRLKKIRQAINYAFDRRKMIRFLRNNIGFPGINGIIPRGLPPYDSTSAGYDYNPEKARKLLAEAGYPDGKGMPPITLTTTSDYLDICKYLQNRLGEEGIQMKIEVSPPAAVKEMKAQAKLPFFRASWIADYPDAENYLSLFSTRNFCPNGPNYTRFSNPKFDKLYDISMAAVNDTLRQTCYHKMDSLIMEEAPVVILYYDQVLRFVQSNIVGMECDPMNLLDLRKVRKY